MMNGLCFFTLNVVINSLFTFFTSWLLVEGIMKIVRLRSLRAKSFLRMIPICKLLLDLFFYDFSRWSFLQGINPLLLEEGSRTLIVGCGVDTSSWCAGVFPKIQCITPGDYTFTVADLIGHALSSSWLQGIVIAFWVCFCLVILWKVAIFCRREEFASQEKGSPFVKGMIRPVIYIPQALQESLSSKELLAIVAHEQEHIRYKDTLFRPVLLGICWLFWWVPTSKLLGKIEEGQEIASDLQCRRYGVDPQDLASALCKTVRFMQGSRCSLPCHYLAKKAVLQRVQFLLEGKELPNQRITVIFSFLIVFFLVLLGKFWIF